MTVAYPDDVLTRQEMGQIMGWFSLTAVGFACGRHLPEKAEKGDLKTLQIIWNKYGALDTIRGEERERLSKERESGRIKPPWEIGWSKEARDLVESQYADGSLAGVDVTRWLFDRLASERGYQQVRDVFAVTFDWPEFPSRMRDPWLGADRPLLFFVFYGQDQIAFRLFKDTFPTTLHVRIDDLFTKAGKPRPFETIPEMQMQGLKEWAGGSKATLAILFTDIVGSTELGNKLGNQAMNEVRCAHFRQARSLIVEHGGYEIKTTGDGLMVAFRTAAEALDCALTLYGNTGDARVKIRAAIHVGPVEIEEEDAFGATANFAARVVAQAEGSEVWISGEAKNHIDQEGTARDEDLVWTAHADRELKGFSGAHLLWSVVPRATAQGA